MVTQTITRDLSDINARVKEAATDLRRERVRLISERVKQVSAPGSVEQLIGRWTLSVGNWFRVLIASQAYF